MASLHELVYGTPIKSDEPATPTTEKKEQRGERKSPKRRTAKKRKRESILVDQTDDAAPPLPVPEKLQGRIPLDVERYQRRKYKTWRWGADRTRASEWETDSHFEKRIERIEARKEYDNLRRRWKWRRHNMEGEIDFGDSIAYLVEQSLKRQRRLRAKEEKEQRRKAQGRKGRHDNDDVSINDEETEEEGDEGESIQSNSASSRSVRFSEGTKPGAEADHAVSSYRDRGYTGPPSNELRGLSSSAVAVRRLRRAKLPTTTEPVFRIKRHPPMQPTDGDPRRPVTEQPIGQNHSSNIQARILRRLGMRSLLMEPFCASSSSSSSSASSSRSLPSTSTSKTEALKTLGALYRLPAIDTESILHVCATEMGAGWEAFQCTKWTDRSRAARAFGIDGMIPPGLLGHKLNTKAGMYKRLRDARERVIEQLGTPITVDDNDDIETGPSMTRKGTTSHPVNGVMQIAWTPTEDTFELDRSETGSASASDRMNKANDSNLENNSSGEIPVVSVGIQPESSGSIPTTTTTTTDVPAPWESYVHRQGTVPPVPSFPLDEVGVVYGGIDPFAKVCRTRKIDHDLALLTIHTLTALQGQARIDGVHGATKGLHSDAMAFVAMLKELNCTVANANMRDRNMRNYPHVGCYRSILLGCSYIVNSGSITHKVPGSTNQSDTQSVASKDTNSYGEFGQRTGRSFDDQSSASRSTNADRGGPIEYRSNMKDAAADLVSLFGNMMKHPGLRRFPRVKSIVAIAMVGQALNGEAAEMLSRAVDGPIGTVRKVLETLEMEDQLVSASTATGNNVTSSRRDATLTGSKVVVGYLELQAFRAIEVLDSCIEAEPLSIEFKAWKLALCGCCVLLCSGNLIGVGGHQYPSTKKHRRVEDNVAPHEVRFRLRTFPKMLRETAKTLLDLIHQLEDNETEGGSAVLTTFLEWHQVMALLIGSLHDNADFSARGLCRTVRDLYSVHLLRSIVDSATTESGRILDRLKQTNALPQNDAMNNLSMRLECDPSKIGLWRKVIREINPIGTNRAKVCPQGCRACGHLINGFRVDHRKKPADWWGHERKSWWNPDLLGHGWWAGSANGNDPRSLFSSRADLEAVQLNLMAKLHLNDHGVVGMAAENGDDDDDDDDDTPEKPAKRKPIDLAKYDWLTLVGNEDMLDANKDGPQTRRRTSQGLPTSPGVAQISSPGFVSRENRRTSLGERADRISLKERKRKLDKYLPSRFDSDDVLVEQPEGDSAKDAREGRILVVDDTHSEEEVIAYKIVLLAYMYSTTHPGIPALARILVARCITESNDIDDTKPAWECIRWLSIRHRLNIPQLLMTASSIT